jgi:hypothetical protein
MDLVLVVSTLRSKHSSAVIFNMTQIFSVTDSTMEAFNEAMETPDEFMVSNAARSPASVTTNWASTSSFSL